MDYYTALLNAVDCSIQLHGPSQRSAVNYLFKVDVVNIGYMEQKIVSYVQCCFEMLSS